MTILPITEEVRKFLIKVINYVIARLPKSLRDRAVRRAIHLPGELPSGLIFKIAETTEELEAAFRLVYDSYLPLGYCTPNILKMRATIYHALPTTTTLIAVDNGKVIGTMTMVRDNRLGLPLSGKFDVQGLRTQSRRVAEITSLVIHRDYRRRSGGQVLFPLLKLMYEYATSYFGVNHLVVTVHPKDAYFYESLLLFEPVPGTTVVDYLGAPAVALHLDLERALIEFKNVYSGRDAKTNLFDFFVQRKMPNVVFPDRRYNTINDPVVSYDYYQKLFIERLKVETSDRRSVEACFRQNDARRSHFRFEIEAPARVIRAESGDSGKAIVKDASRRGFRAYFYGGFEISQEIQLQIEVAPGMLANVTARPVWMTPDRGVGFDIVTADEIWNSFINFLYVDHFKAAA
jgi:hypothetical protein